TAAILVRRSSMHIHEEIIRRRGRITIGLRSQGGVVESILRVAGHDIIGGIGITKMAAVADMIREMKLVMHNDPTFLSKWPALDAAPFVERMMPIYPR